ncbi:BamA/TamA family outer membrane protein [Laspinema olomoucense]|uniref:BamA/TamA family outer membrane protein n=1 Tax=Laspinema olomoucense TaxID=3231600 RepID=UPI0021BB3E19|nr:BamA/TamA family outer membrane protein [Laspinema sp. D3c]MCT7991409.1 BamA/TamA family outer membrane protein [Laspinema sp. D3a]MCT7995994.1 BamA/TamA family outer membrane protein [Laspinema sp. D3c]
MGYKPARYFFHRPQSLLYPVGLLDRQNEPPDTIMESVGVNGMTANIILYKSLEALALLLGATSVLLITRLPAWGQGTETTPLNLQSLYPPAADWLLPATPSRETPPPPPLLGPTQSSDSAEGLKGEGLERGISQQRPNSPTQPQRPELENIEEELEEEPDFAIVPFPRYSSIKGIHGTVDLILTNLGENDQTLDLRLEGGERTIGAVLRYTDPWLESGPSDSGYQVRLFNTRSPEPQFLEGDREVNLIHDHQAWVDRLGGSFSFYQPVTPTGVVLSAGASYQRVAIRNSAFTSRLYASDRLGNPLTLSEQGLDTLVTLNLGLLQDRRNSNEWPTQGYRFQLATEQSIPVGSADLLFNRLSASFTQFVPFQNQTFVFNLQGGTILGDVPPYQAFNLGGSDSVRGYQDGEIGTGQSYIQGTVEYRFPLIEDLNLPYSSALGGTVFADFASDLGSADSVFGEPGEVRNKPGKGFGLGLGVRLLTDFGPVRLEFAVSDQQDLSAIFKIGERF